jgi:hypothetical protein
MEVIMIRLFEDAWLRGDGRWLLTAGGSDSRVAIGNFSFKLRLSYVGAAISEKAAVQLLDINVTARSQSKRGNRANLTR